MFTLKARNVNDAYAEAMWLIAVMGVRKESRAGATLSAPFPVTTLYSNPTERMLFDPVRDANPFFHIFEGIWMLAGRNDVAWISQFNSNMVNFSDDGHTFHGTYGFRWREHFGVDQIKFIIKELIRNPETRRAVLAMWDPNADLAKIKDGLDVPCNTTIYFTVRNGGLEMTVCCRSNDIVWGCYGANAVHMSMLHEFVAQATGLPVGAYYQISNDWHVYEKHFQFIGKVPPEREPYPEGHFAITNSDQWLDDLENNFPMFIEKPEVANTRSRYVDLVLQPMMYAWNYYKQKQKDAALMYVNKIADEAIRKACREWLNRRKWA